MTLTQKSLAVSVGLFVIAVLLVEIVLTSRPLVVEGSTLQGQEYMATTTAANSVYGATVTGSTLIRTGSGSINSVIITGANTGIVNIYDATTSSILLRATRMSTSTILIATLPASIVAGTYTFDATYSNGLYVDLIGGNMPTSTITYR